MDCRREIAKGFPKFMVMHITAAIDGKRRAMFNLLGFWALFAPLLFPADATAVVSSIPPKAGQHEKRIALVIGNSRYASAPLRNPVNDARLMAESLHKAGFDVQLRENLSRGAMLNAVRDFGERIKGGAVGLFYYSGHGMQIKGRNYLIPVDADIRNEDEVESLGLDANLVLRKMDSARSPVNIVILDACRNNPFERSFRSAAVGLAQMDAPKGTLIAFSTAPGSVALDGNGANSLYTYALATSMNSASVPIEQAFKQVRVAVSKATKDKQIPWESSSLTGDFYFMNSGAPQKAASSIKLASIPPALPPASDLAATEKTAKPKVKSQIEARKELSSMGVAWEKDSLYQAIEARDGLLIDLFIAGKMTLGNCDLVTIIPNPNSYEVIEKFSSAGLIEKGTLSAPCESQDTKARSKYHQLASPMIEKLNKGLSVDFEIRKQRWEASMKEAIRQGRDAPELPHPKSLILLGVEVTPLISAIWFEDEKLAHFLTSIGANQKTNGALTVSGLGDGGSIGRIPLKAPHDTRSGAKIVVGAVE